MNQNISVKKKSGVIAREADQKIIILDPKEGSVYTLNDTAAYIWKFLHKKRSVSEILKKIADDFEVPESKIRKDVINFIQKGIKNKLLQKSN